MVNKQEKPSNRSAKKELGGFSMFVFTYLLEYFKLFQSSYF